MTSEPVASVPPRTPAAVRRASWSTGGNGALHGLAAVWSDLDRHVRLVVVGTLAVAAALLGTGAAISVAVRDQLLEATGSGVEAVAAAVGPDIPSLADGTALTPADVDTIEALRERFLPNVLFVKIWSLDGTILYADDPSLVGMVDAERLVHLEEAVQDGVSSRLMTEDSRIAARLPATAEQVVEHYVILRDDAGRPEAVLAAFEEAGATHAAFEFLVHAMRGTTHLGVVLVAASVLIVLRARHRAAVARRDRDLALIADAVDSTAAALHPTAVADALRTRLADELRLRRFEIAAGSAVTGRAEFVRRLRDGSTLVADRGEPLGREERKILHAAGRAVDAAITNHRTFESIQAAHARELASRSGEPAETTDASRQLVDELHDTVGAKLMRTLYAVRRAGMMGAQRADELHAAIRSIEAMVEDTEAHLRAFLARASAEPAVGDLGALVECTASRFEADTGVQVRHRVVGDASAVGPDARVVLARAIGEALTNVLKHAGADRVRVAIAAGPRCVRLRITDDGTGPESLSSPPPGHGNGLAYLRERVSALGGTVCLQAASPRGARLEISIPMGGNE